MSIRPGQEWGSPGRLAPEAPIFSSDRSAALWLQVVLGPEIGGDQQGSGDHELGLIGGDLHRSLGAPSRDEAALRAGQGVRYPLDVGEVRLDGGTPQLFLAHLVAVARPRSGLFEAETVVVMNATHMGSLDLGPRAHPGDGRLDITTGVLARRDRRQARRRMRSGTHVPHPDLAQRRVRTTRLELDPRHHVRLDGEEVGTASVLELRCVADAVVVVA